MNVGIPLIFVPITVAAYDGIPHAKTDQASAIINAARNVGGSATASRSPIMCSRTANSSTKCASSSMPIPSGIPYQNALQQLTQYFVAEGSSLLQAQQQAVAWVGQQVQTQAAYLAYIDVFWALMLIAAAAIPLALALRNVKLGGPAPMGH